MKSAKETEKKKIKTKGRRNNETAVRQKIKTNFRILHPDSLHQRRSIWKEKEQRKRKEKNFDFRAISFQLTRSTGGTSGMSRCGWVWKRKKERKEGRKGGRKKKKQQKEKRQGQNMIRSLAAAFIMSPDLPNWLGPRAGPAACHDQIVGWRRSIGRLRQAKRMMIRMMEKKWKKKKGRKMMKKRKQKREQLPQSFLVHSKIGDELIERVPF